MHFCTRMLFETKRSTVTGPCVSIKRLYNYIANKAILNVSDMAFLIEFLSIILEEISDGESISGMWVRLKM
jgi:hypothetical protein